MSNLPHNIEATRKLSDSEIRSEIAWAHSVIADTLRSVGMMANVALEMNRRFTRRMGDALVKPSDYAGRRGRIRLSASALWLRATPTKRRNTIVHELAHILAELEAGPMCRVGHGAGWKRMMLRLGEQPVRCHTVNRDGLRRRNRRRGVRRAPARRVPVARLIRRPAAPTIAVVTHRGQMALVTVLHRNEKTISVRLESDLGNWLEGQEIRVTPDMLG